MTEVAMMLKAVDYMVQLLKGREAISAKDHENRVAFAKVFRDALVQTRAYIADQRDGIIERDRNRERELSQAWNLVGIKAQDVPGGDELNDLYYGKADYWSDPTGWEKSELSGIDISLERAESEAKNLMPER